MAGRLLPGSATINSGDAARAALLETQFYSNHKHRSEIRFNTIGDGFIVVKTELLEEHSDEAGHLQIPFLKETVLCQQLFSEDAWDR